MGTVGWFCKAKPAVDPPNPQLMGYDPQLFLNLTPERLEQLTCPVCIAVVRNPPDLECGHLVCDACLQATNKSECPIDRSFVDRAACRGSLVIRLEIEREDIACPHAALGCRWVGTLGSNGRHLNDHLALCEFEGTVCTFCDAEGIRRDRMANHQANECDKRFVVCELCSENVHRSELANHQTAVGEVPCKGKCLCPNSCTTVAIQGGSLAKPGQDPVRTKMVIRKSEVDAHRLVCPEEKQCCELCGPQDPSLTRATMVEHNRTHQQTHVMIRVMRDQAREQQAQMQGMQDRILILERGYIPPYQGV